jgi:enediyne biosynthesis protein E4
MIARRETGRNFRATPLALALLLGCSSGGEGGGGLFEPLSKRDQGYAPGADAAGLTERDAAPPGSPDLAGTADTAAPDPGPQAVCLPHAPWSGDRPAFIDVTAGSSLLALGVTGVRLGAVDYNGDGLADLSVRNHRAGVRDDYMPGGDRQTWLLRNEGGFHFEDVTRSSGFSATFDGGEGRATHVVVWGDIDNDGDLDALSAATVDRNPSSIDAGDRTETLINSGEEGFILVSSGELRHGNERLPVHAMSLTDFDRDGLLDVLVGFDLDYAGRPVPVGLYQGYGTGSFVNVSDALGVTPDPKRGPTRSWGTTACDLDGDGVPELLTSAYGRASNGLWTWRGGAYADVAIAAGFAYDHREDWSTNLNAQCFCKLNPDAEDCAGVPPPPSNFRCVAGSNLRWYHDYDRDPSRLGGNTFSTVCADVDDDGDLDLLNLEIVHWDVGDTSDPSELLVNSGPDNTTGLPFGFERPGNERTGLERTWPIGDWNAGDMTGAVFDFDNDGRKDVLICSSDYPATRAFLFRQTDDLTFEEVSPELGIDHARAHGVAIADFDGDGDLDVALGHSRSRCEGDTSCLETAEVHLFRNEVGQDSNWLRIDLEGAAGTNRAAVGARLTATAGARTQTLEVSGGYGHFGIQHELTQHFGLGAACVVERLEIRWPDANGSVEIFENVPANSRIRIVQGRGSYELLPSPKP